MGVRGSRAVAVVGWLAAVLAGFVLGRMTGGSATLAPGGPAEGVERGESRTPEAPRHAAPPLLGSAPASVDRPSTHVDVDLRWFPREKGTTCGPEPLGHSLWPALVKIHAREGRISDAVAVVRAALANGATPEEVAGVLTGVDPARVVALIEALRGAGIDLPLDPGWWAMVRAKAGRAAEVVAEDGEAFSVVQEEEAFSLLVAEALRKGTTVARLRAQAERDDWPDWKRSRVTDALELVRSAEASAWSAWADERATAEARQRETEWARQRVDVVGSARDQVASTPKDPAAWAALGEALLFVGDPAGAADAYDRALELNPFFEDAATMLARTAPDRLVRRVAERWREVREDGLLLVLAEAYLRLARGREAAETFFRCSDLPPAWLAAGIPVLAPDVALRSIEPRLGRVGGRDPLLLAAKALAEAALGRTADAEGTVRRLFEDDDGAEAWTVALDAAPSTALAHFETWRADLPGDDDRRAFLAEALRRSGRVAEARDVLEPFVASQPEWPTWGHVSPYVAALDPDRWAPRLRALLDRDAEDVSQWAAWAAFCSLVGRRDEALAAYDRAMALADGDMRYRILRLRVR